MACFGYTPNSAEDLGVCTPACTDSSQCNSGTSTQFACDTNSGICKCTRSSDCGTGYLCDTNSGSCYQPCTDNSTCSYGCCASVGSLQYCDFDAQAPTTSTTGTSGTTGTTGGLPTPWPQIPVQNSPAAVLSSPKLVPIFFAPWTVGGTQHSYSYTQHAEDYTSWIMTSSWLSEVGADYGVGTGTRASPVILSDVPPTTVLDADIQTLISQKIQNGTLPQPDANTLYMIFYPQETTIYEDAAHQYQSCTFFGGYHYEFLDSNLGGQEIVYAVIPDCTGQPNYTMPFDLDIAVSHELIEASTDPYTIYNPAYIFNDTNSPWGFTFGEVGDMCIENTYTDPVSGNSAQRIWSNSLALGSRSPCAPLPTSGDFYGAYVTPNQTAVASPGGTVNLTIHTWSTNPTAPSWYGLVYPNSSTFPGTTLSPDYSNSSTPAVFSDNGTITFSMTIPSNAPRSTQNAASYAYYWVYTFPNNTSDDSMWWPVVVYVQ